MAERGQATYQEILSQPTVWRQALEGFYPQVGSLLAFFDKNPFDRAIFTGCGSTYYLSLTAASLFQESVKIPAQARPASELLLFPNLVYLPGSNTLLVAISRSGETSETIRAVKNFREMDSGKVLVITCDSQSPLAEMGDFLLSIDQAQEISIAQTRSFASMLVISQALAAAAGGRNLALFNYLPARVGEIFDKYSNIAKKIGENLSLDRFFFLGTGHLYGIACEAMLKMKEMTVSYSEAFHMLEFRHGPMSMVNHQSLVVGLVSHSAKKKEVDVLKQMQDLGGKILPIGFDLQLDSILQGDKIELGEVMPDWLSPVLYLPVLQLAAYYRSMAKGLNPDKPTNLDAVVKLDTL